MPKIITHEVLSCAFLIIVVLSAICLVITLGLAIADVLLNDIVPERLIFSFLAVTIALIFVSLIIVTIGIASAIF